VLRYGLRHLRDPATADDLVQEVLVLMLERLRSGRIRDPDRLASFVLGACRLVVRNLRRGQRRREGLLGRFAWAFPRESTPDKVGLDRARLRGCLGFILFFVSCIELVALALVPPRPGR
jgi:RNA polymerase sigma-70 factor (ECF subfamily)